MPPVFKVEERKHHPIVQAYWDRKLSHAQASAQLKDLGCEQWEIDLFLDGDLGDIE